MPIPHDAGYKALFGHPDLIRELIDGFIPDGWLRSLDYNTLEKVPGSYVSEDFREREDDVVWRVKVGEEWAYLYLVIEFQSSVDRHMALRMMVYVGLLYQDLLKRGEIARSGLLPPVLPIVLYNGERRWDAAQDVADLVPDVPGLMERFKPHMRYLLIDEGSYDHDRLASQRNVVAAIFRLEHMPRPEVFGEIVASLEAWLIDRPDLRRLMVSWIAAFVGQRTGADPTLADSAGNLSTEWSIMLTERMKQWEQEFWAKGRLEGELKGKLEGEQASLRRLLTRKFGELTPALLERIAQADLVQVEAWLDRVLDAATIGDVFGSEGALH